MNYYELDRNSEENYISANINFKVIKNMKSLMMLCQSFKSRCMLMKTLYVGCCCILFVGCEKKGLTEDEMQLVQTAIKSEVIAETFDDKITSVWNEQITEQLEAAGEKFVEKLYDAPFLISDYYDALESLGQQLGSHGTVDYKVKWVANVVETYEKRFKEVRDGMVADIKKDYRKSRQRMDAVDAYYHSTTPEKSDSLYRIYESLELRETKPYDGWNTVANTSRWAQNTEWIDKLCDSTTKFDVTPLLYKDFQRIDFMTENYNYFIFKVMYKIFLSVSDVEIDYIVKEAETENSFEIGFTNHKAYLCTFTESKKSTRVTYQPIEYDQTYIGMGIE